MILHSVLNVLAVIIGGYVSYRVGSIKLVAVNIIMATLLWLYSVKYKAYFLVGNLLVSFATAMTITLVWLFDTTALISSINITPTYLSLASKFMWLYAGFAFVISLIRELIKDIEDIEGDRKVGCTTIPVVLGIKKTKYVLIGLLVASILAIAYISYIAYISFHLKLIFWYLIITVALPFLYLVYFTVIAKKKNDFSHMSKITKFIMVAGVFSMILIFF
jgi:4-hydroxybenzoate polyprenyltransferase